jgi:23S rRNA 5-hydroxycytidine C2501 synthase
MKQIELLAPARNAQTAIAAIQCGADAVYIGASSFGARQAACNPIEEIKKVIDYAHPYYVKVYVTLNTLLYDEEIPGADRLIRRLYQIGIDGLIIQDTGLLALDLPPIPLIASTQMNNDTPEKVKFLEETGFSRAILARELTLDQIRQIRRATSIELECFIHGSLCVGASSQCYMSYAIGGRSGNRGNCAQPCRKLYTLKDHSGKKIVENRYLLSLKDLNLSDYIEQLIDAGVTAFKIEGRLKEIPYVANTTGFYRQKFDAVLQKKILQRASSGTTRLNFKPNPDKTFNRGFTDYGIAGQSNFLGSIDTPKSVGEFVGTVTKVEKSAFVLDGNVPLHNADGICFYDSSNNLTGTVINKVGGQKIWPQKMDNIRLHLKIYRNFDYQFSKNLEKKPAERKILISMVLQETKNSFLLAAKDENGNRVVYEFNTPKQPALKKNAAQETIITQLKKLGNTIFECSSVKIDLKQDYFFPVSALNAARRELIRNLLEVRQANRPRKTAQNLKNSACFPQKHLTYLGNCLNEKARNFYRRHGVESIDPAAESGLDMTGRLVMTTKYCIRKELDLCPKNRQAACADPLILADEDNRQFRIEFRCGRCGMNIYFIKA